VKIRRKNAERMVTLKPNTHDGYVELGKVRGDPRKWSAATFPLVGITARPSMETRCWPV